VTWHREIIARITGLLRRSKRDHYLEEEIRAHLELLADQHVRQGMNLEEARHAARREFGGIEQAKEAYRDQSGVPWLEVISRELRFGARALRNSPTFTVSVVFTLALGLGVFTAIFSITESILWKPFPYPQSERLVTIYAKSVSKSRSLDLVTIPEYLSWKENNKTLEQLAAYRWAEEHVLKAGANLERARVAPVTQEFFSTLRVNPSLGRDFRGVIDSDSRSGVILTYSCWQRLFGPTRDLSGKTIQLESDVHPVIGVLPPSFTFEYLWKVDVFVLADFPPTMATDRSTRPLQTIGRLREGVSPASAQADFSRLARNDASAFPETDASWGVLLESLRVSATHYYQPRLLFFLGAALVVFVIACANAANLLLARTFRRRAELALRISLGASRWTLIRQALAESVWLAALASICGLFLAYWGVRVFIHFASAPEMEIPRVREIGTDFYVFTFAAVAALLAVVFAGIPAARLACRVDPNEALKSAGKGMSGGVRERSLRNVLVTAELGLCMVLLVGAGLFIDSMVRLERVSPGFDPHHLLTMRVSLRGPQRDPETHLRTILDASAFLEKIRTLPDVEAAEIGSTLPFFAADEVGFAVGGQPEPAQGMEPTTAVRAVTRNYFSALRIPVVRGRPFSPGDVPASPRVAVINLNFARHFFAGENPIGRTIKLVSVADGSAIKTGVYEIVGVVGNSKEVGLNEVDFDALYIPFQQNPIREAFLAVRTRGDAADLPGILRREAALLDPQRPPFDVVPMEQIISTSLSENRLHLLLSTAFAAAALLLAAVGVYGVLSYGVEQRSREIGVRMALGAQPTTVSSMIVLQSCRLLFPGIVLGLALALALGRLLSGMLYLVPQEHDGLLYGVSTHDPLVLTATTLLLTILTLLGSFFPARRATRIDPITALRSD
jgi:predicted permease